ncbi:MAG TPA: hypothetical protein VN861_01590 [Candidatus Acidoferrales bacterium]|nr:hypothetical protein [Candidatus Acidoferrales bacterium]
MTTRAAIPYTAISRADSEAAPWYVWCGLVGASSIVFGLYWDISWHMSIGRDTFWTPAHLLIQFGGILMCLVSTYLIFSTTFGNDPVAKAASVKVWGFRGPLGAFTACWGGVVMVTSAPFDNWWHNSFGLDVQIVSPPHMVLGIGILGVGIGALLLLASRMNRAEGAERKNLLRMYLYLGGVLLALHLLFVSEYSAGDQMHGTTFYLAVSLGVPLILVALARASGYRWGATWVAAIYTLIHLAQLWVMPLFPATPKLGPVYTNVTHMIPLQFPVLIIIPAIVIDFLLNRYAQKNKWLLAAMLGAAYLFVMLLVHWPLGNFLIAPAARNWIFGQNYFAYVVPPSDYHWQFEFVDRPATFALFCRGMGIALVVAILSSRVGLAAGDALRRLRR